MSSFLRHQSDVFHDGEVFRDWLSARHWFAGTSPTNVTFVNEAARQLQKLAGFEQTGVHFHSLLAETQAHGGGIKRFREFVVFDGSYTYPVSDR